MDYLTLHTGRKFEVPFDVFIVFATNLKPESLDDEAFLRRIPYKVPAKNPTVDEYCHIFELNCRKRGILFDPVTVECLQRCGTWSPSASRMPRCWLVRSARSRRSRRMTSTATTRRGCGGGWLRAFSRRARLAGRWRMPA